MKTLDIETATEPIAEYVRAARHEPVVFTVDGKPVAALFPMGDSDSETTSLSVDPRFLAIIERSRARLDEEGPVSAAEMRRRLQADG